MKDGTPNENLTFTPGLVSPGESRRKVKKVTSWGDLEKVIDRAGWRMVKVKHGYLTFPSLADAPPIHVGGTPSDWRALKNAKSALRRAGLAV